MSNETERKEVREKAGEEAEGVGVGVLKEQDQAGRRRLGLCPDRQFN